MNGLETILTALGDGPIASAFRVVGLLLVPWAVLVGTLAFMTPEKKSMAEVFGQARRRQDQRGIQLLTRGGEILLIAHLLLFVLSTSEARSRLVDTIEGHQDPRVYGEALSISYNGLGFWAVTSLLGMAAYAVARWSGRKERPVQPWLWLALAQLALVTFYSLQRVPLTLKALASLSNPGDPFEKLQQVSDTLGETLLFTELALVLIVATCVLCVILWRRHLRKVGGAFEPRLVGPIAVFALGLISFTLTRAYRFDAHHPVQASIGSFRDCRGMMTRDMPQRDPGVAGEPIQAPLLKIGGADTGIVDGTAGNVEQLTKVMRDKRKLWHQLMPGVEFPGQVLLSVPGHLPLKDVKPWMANLEQEGFTRFYAVVLVPHRVHTSKTLGNIKLTQACWTLPVGPKSHASTTWDQHVAAASL